MLLLQMKAEAVTTIQPGCDEGVDETLCWIVIQVSAQLTGLMDCKRSCRNNVIHMVFHLKCFIDSNSETLCSYGDSNDSITDGNLWKWSYDGEEINFRRDVFNFRFINHKTILYTPRFNIGNTKLHARNSLRSCTWLQNEIKLRLHDINAIYWYLVVKKKKRIVEGDIWDLFTFVKDSWAGIGGSNSICPTNDGVGAFFPHTYLIINILIIYYVMICQIPLHYVK